MFLKVAVVLTTLVYSGFGIPLESEPQHEMKRFLSERIVGGIDAPPEYGKHMAALVWGETFISLICGGSIITKQHILTAAHCIDPMIMWDQLISSFRAVVGSHIWKSAKKNIGFSGFVNHPEFSWNTLKNDIGVLYLAKDITISDNVAIIPLNYDWKDGGVESYVTGWGRLGFNSPLPYKLQLLYVHTLTPRQCFAGLHEASEGWGGVPPHDPVIEICTLHSIGHGMCNGDSGSALVHKETQTQIGIVSWGFPCARGAPDVFVRISGFPDWISEQIGFKVGEQH